MEVEIMVIIECMGNYGSHRNYGNYWRPQNNNSYGRKIDISNGFYKFVVSGFNQIHNFDNVLVINFRAFFRNIGNVWFMKSIEFMR